MIEVKDLGYFARFYGPVSQEVRSKEPIILTPERMSYDWWGVTKHSKLAPMVKLL